MATVWEETFNSVGYDKGADWSENVGSGSIINEDASNDGSFSGESLRIYSTGNNAYTSVSFDATVDTAYFRVEFYCDSFPLASTEIAPLIIGRTAANANLFMIRLYGGYGDGPRHNLVVYNDTRGTQYLTAGSTYDPAQKQVIEVRYDVSSNVWGWYINGVYENDAQLNAGVSQLAQLSQVGIAANAFGTYDITIDNLLIDDTFYVGEAPVTAPEFQYLLPSSDITVGNWLNESGIATLYTSIDEDEGSISDADYIHSEDNPTNSPAVVKLAGGLDPESDLGHQVEYRIGQGDTGSISLTVELRQGYVSEGTPGTLIASWLHSDLTSITTYTQDLSEAEAANITDYSDLYLRFVATV